MNYLIVENGIITNIIVADESFAEAIGAKSFYDGATIGGKYTPPPPPLDDITQIQLAIAELAEAAAQNNMNNKLAIAELAEIVAGGKTNG